LGTEKTTIAMLIYIVSKIAMADSYLEDYEDNLPEEGSMTRINLRSKMRRWIWMIRDMTTLQLFLCLCYSAYFPVLRLIVIL
ncbi:hypothetical protein ACJX0J_021392, partial [Zea mays]